MIVLRGWKFGHFEKKLKHSRNCALRQLRALGVSSTTPQRVSLLRCTSSGKGMSLRLGVLDFSVLRFLR